ncbi:mycothiol synthase [Leucobacter ruminantium]|uniref:Mycothiol synthase n=1 Tax=Leucobacter ruminantium TaxID=1289170 RepID=A0A939LUW8_9MICO|nr:mycothiol synthase [Leucobacter ruminantium]MBO1804851.1 mycothiol synthase [Leucobacter ruminantium]
MTEAELIEIDPGSSGEPGTRALADARAVIAAAESADGRPPVSDQALLAASQGRRALRRFAEAADPERTVAVGIVGEGEVDLVVDPSARGRGIGSAALDVLLDRAAPGELKAWAHGDNPAADALLARAGFEPVRSLYRMALDPSRLPDPSSDPLALPMPTGFALRAFDPELPEDAADWVRLNAAAFASHPEQGRITEADFALMREEPWFDPADLLFIEDAEGVAGYTWVKTVPGEGSAPIAELYAIGVDPARSGHGLGRALLEATLARMAQHRPAKVELYVDGENEVAVGMYERAGFTIDSRSRQWRR